VTVRGASRSEVSSAARGLAGRPVVLVTFDVPVVAEASELAVDAAVESGQPLVVVNVVEMSIRPMTASWGQEVVVAEDVDDSLRAPAELAQALGVAVERIRLLSPRPLAALLELVAERDPSLVVVGADRGRMSARRLARAERKIREATSCLVWTSGALEVR
jgi:nucleotide-binding universal stress UspA family protein